MLKQVTMRSSRPILYLAAFEFFLLLLSFYIGLMASWASPGDLWLGLTGHLPQALFYAAVLSCMMYAVGLYHAHYFATVADAAIRLAVAIVFSLIVFSLVFYVAPYLIIWRAVMTPALIIAFLAICATRFVTLHFVNFDLLKRRVVVLGIGERASQIERLEQKGRAFGFTCIGYLDIAKEARKVPANRLIARERAIDEIVRSEKIDEIVVAVQDRRGHLPMDALMQCRARGIGVVDYQTFFERETGSVDLEALHMGWFLFSPGFNCGGLHKGVKRALDICVSLVFLVAFLPLYLGAALAIRLESRGPILFRQTRVGANGNPFVLLKFRSMRVDAEGDGRPQWATANDPRITRVGQVFRKLRIDELPQVFNVLRGDMSFVGPRPERPFFVNQLLDEIPYYGERHRVKPGITGWAQLNYSYGASIEDAKHKHQYDLYYVKHGSILLDLIIILQTVRVIFWPDGVR